MWKGLVVTVVYFVVFFVSLSTKCDVLLFVFR